MNNLEEEVRSVIMRIRDIDRSVKIQMVNPDNVISTLNYRAWAEKIELVERLENVLPLFPVRDNADKGLVDISLCVQREDYNPTTATITYGGVAVPIGIARLLAINTYLSAYWSLYDCLTNIIGRVLGPDSIRTSHLGRMNPKLVGTFLSDETQKGKEKPRLEVLGLRGILMESFGNYIGLSYLLRNCYIHEGGMVDALPILSDEMSNGCFVVQDSVAEKLNQEISNRYNISNVTIVKPGDLDKQLRDCHSILDKMFVSLLRFMMGTLAVEIESFAEIDGFKLP